MRKLLNILLLILLTTLSGCYSCQSWHELWGTDPVEAGGAHKLFFDKDCRPVVKPAAAPVKPRPKRTPVSGCGPSTVSRNYPGMGCGVVKLDKTMPREVQLNAPFDYMIKVTNLTDVTVSDVMVTEHLSKNFKFSKAMPQAKMENGKLIWKIVSLEPKESGQIRVYGRASSTDCIKNCATATYKIPACANVKVVEPMLKLVKSAPSEVLLCDPIAVKFIVTNSGTGSAKDVKIEDSLPSGLVTSEGRDRIMINVGTLATGQSREFSVMLKAKKTGKYFNTATASSSGGLKSEAETTTIVQQPVLTITKTGPERQYIGRNVTYEITVANKGDATAKNVVVTDSIPSGTKFVSASNGGELSMGKVVWKMSSLAVGRSQTVSVTVSPGKAGNITNTAMAEATCAKGVRVSAGTRVEGISAVLLEVVDVDDPVEIGGQTTYVIIATNQGSSPGTNIRIVCTLEDNEQYISSSGATMGTFLGNTVTFEPLRSLSPKNKATWRIVVKAVKVGDVRFRVTMNTDQLTRPVEETEATHLYE